MDRKIDKLYDQNKETHVRQEKTEQALGILQERMQENTRSFLIDAHNKFCYQLKKIDDLNLQSIERQRIYSFRAPLKRSEVDSRLRKLSNSYQRFNKRIYFEFWG